MTADVRALPLMSKIVVFAVAGMVLVTMFARAQEIQDDPNLPADQLEASS